MPKKKIAVLLGNDFEDSEFRHPVDSLTNAGHEVEVLGVETGSELVGKQGKEKVTPNARVSDREVGDYDAVLIPGGYSPDHLRTDEGMVSFVKSAFAKGLPIAAICHAPHLLIEADVVRERTITSWPSVKTDLENAGAKWVDREVVVDAPLITSRNPDDLEAFSNALLEQLA